KRHDELVLAVCDAAIDLLSVLFGVEACELRSPTRARKNAARVRQVGMYALNVGLGMKMGDIALGFSRDRSTVIHACHLIEDMRDDPDFDAVVCRVEAVFSISFQFVPIGKNEPSFASASDGD
ncbi:MAG: helix-turn-helix domain-containing protein, partial [Ahrensia sp.]